MPASATLCVRPPRGGSTTVLKTYPTPEAGVRAALTPKCGPKCLGAHLLVLYDAGGQPHVARLPKPPPPPLADELKRCYRRDPVSRPDLWAVPAELNQPFGSEVVKRLAGTGTLDTTIQQSYPITPTITGSGHLAATVHGVVAPSRDLPQEQGSPWRY